MGSYDTLRRVHNRALDAILHLEESIIDEILRHGDCASHPVEIMFYDENYARGIELVPSADPVLAVKIIEDLKDYETIPTGNWKEDWRMALALLASHTYRQAVEDSFTDYMNAMSERLCTAEGEGTISLQDSVGVLEWDPGVTPEKALKELRQDLSKFIRAFVDGARPD